MSDADGMQRPSQQRDEEKDRDEEEKENRVDCYHETLSHSVCRKKKRKSLDLSDKEISLQRGELRAVNSSSCREIQTQPEKSNKKKISASARFLVVEREARRNRKEKKDDNLRSISRGKIKSKNHYLYAKQQQGYEDRDHEEATASSQKNAVHKLRQKEDKGEDKEEEEENMKERKKDKNDTRETPGFFSEKRRKEEEEDEEEEEGEETRHVIRLRIDIGDFNLLALLRYMILGDESQLRT